MSICVIRATAIHTCAATRWDPDAGNRAPPTSIDIDITNKVTATQNDTGDSDGTKGAAVAKELSAYDEVRNVEQSSREICFIDYELSSACIQLCKLHLTSLRSARLQHDSFFLACGLFNRGQSRFGHRKRTWQSLELLV